MKFVSAVSLLSAAFLFTAVQQSYAQVPEGGSDDTWYYQLGTASNSYEDPSFCHKAVEAYTANGCSRFITYQTGDQWNNQNLIAHEVLPSKSTSSHTILTRNNIVDIINSTTGFTYIDQPKIDFTHVVNTGDGSAYISVQHGCYDNNSSHGLHTFRYENGSLSLKKILMDNRSSSYGNYDTTKQFKLVRNSDNISDSGYYTYFIGTYDSNPSDSSIQYHIGRVYGNGTESTSFTSGARTLVESSSTIQRFGSHNLTYGYMPTGWTDGNKWDVFYDTIHNQPRAVFQVRVGNTVYVKSCIGNQSSATTLYTYTYSSGFKALHGASRGGKSYVWIDGDQSEETIVIDIPSNDVVASSDRHTVKFGTNSRAANYIDIGTSGFNVLPNGRPLFLVHRYSGLYSYSPRNLSSTDTIFGNEKEDVGTVMIPNDIATEQLVDQKSGNDPLYPYINNIEGSCIPEPIFNPRTKNMTICSEVKKTTDADQRALVVSTLKEGLTGSITEPYTISPTVTTALIAGTGISWGNKTMDDTIEVGPESLYKATYSLSVPSSYPALSQMYLRIFDSLQGRDSSNFGALRNYTMRSFTNTMMPGSTEAIYFVGQAPITEVSPCLDLYNWGGTIISVDVNSIKVEKVDSLDTISQVAQWDFRSLSNHSGWLTVNGSNPPVPQSVTLFMKTMGALFC